MSYQYNFHTVRNSSQKLTSDNILADETFQELIPTILLSIYEGISRTLQNELTTYRWNFYSPEMYENALADFGQDDFIKHWDINYAIKTIEEIAYGILAPELELALDNWSEEIAEEIEQLFASFIEQNVAQKSATFDYISIIHKLERPKEVVGYYEIYLDKNGQGILSVYDRNADNFLEGFYSNLDELMQYLTS